MRVEVVSLGHSSVVEVVRCFLVKVVSLRVEVVSLGHSSVVVWCFWVEVVSLLVV